MNYLSPTSGKGVSFIRRTCARVALHILPVCIVIGMGPGALAAGAAPVIEALKEGLPRIDGAQCEFRDKTGVVFRSNWVDTAWMKIDGKVVRFKGLRNDDQRYADFTQKRWRETFQGAEIKATVDLKQTGEGKDSTNYSGSLVVRRGAAEKRLAVSGGCAA